MKDEDKNSAGREIAFQCDGKCRVCPFPGANCLNSNTGCANGECEKSKGENNA